MVCEFQAVCGDFSAAQFEKKPEPESPAANLPREIYAAFFSRLSQTELLTIITRVCKTWRVHVYLPELWASLGSDFARPFSWTQIHSSLLRHVYPSSPNLTSLDLSRCHEYLEHVTTCLVRSRDSTCRDVAAVARDVTHLTLPFTTPDHGSGQPSDCRSAHLVARLPSLLHLNLHSPRRYAFGLPLSVFVPCDLLTCLPPSVLAVLKSLTIGKGSRVDAASLSPILARCPSLERLSVSLSFDRCHVAESFVESLAATCPNLTHLDVETYDLGLPETVATSLMWLTKLTHLSLDRCLLSEQVVEALAARLCHVSIDSDLLVNPKIEHAPALTTLVLKSYRMESVALANCPALTSLSASSGSANATGELGVSLDGTPTLTSLRVSGFARWSVVGDMSSVRHVTVPALDDTHASALPLTLRSLRVASESAPSSSSVCLETLASLLANQKHLESLHVDALRWAPAPTPTSTPSLTRCPPSLRSLSVGGWVGACPSNIALRCPAASKNSPAPAASKNSPAGGVLTIPLRSQLGSIVGFGFCPAPSSRPDWTICSPGLRSVEIRGFEPISLPVCG
mmetsp:Transcript_6403/g.11069  ORF Transcript_6403/g.11069 Transcript_6403/m.11069 type:complete len:569 (-) Transcript_6403:1443-3149(-)